MKITKYGHCCMLVEENGLRILIDPGGLTDGKEPTQNIDVLLITHEHMDHFHVPAVARVRKDSPNVKIYTIPSVGELLKKENAAFALLTHGKSVTERGVLIEAMGEKHAVMHPDLPQSDNTGFFIANRFFFPGDAFTDPAKPVEILALPVAGPWMKLSEAVDYARKLKPNVWFPVHDGVVTAAVRPMLSERMPDSLLKPHGIQMRLPKDGEAMDFA